jgi:hypothetical protein
LLELALLVGDTFLCDVPLLSDLSPAEVGVSPLGVCHADLEWLCDLERTGQ